MGAPSRLSFGFVFAIVLISGLFNRKNHESDHPPKAGGTGTQPVQTSTVSTRDDLAERHLKDPPRAPMLTAFDQALERFQRLQKLASEACKGRDRSYCDHEAGSAELAWIHMWRIKNSFNRHEYNARQQQIRSIPQSFTQLRKTWR